ncbi:MAG: hypothetical protein H7Y30_09520, partial [Pyrinomonadaceae bacterium]|nr:hypothetical protein [Pyrinomonadaceae bacterium]
MFVSRHQQQSFLQGARSSLHRKLQALACVMLFSSLVLLLAGGACVARASQPWSAKLDGRVRFYQATELGVLLIGTEKSLYGIEAETGEVLWRRKDARLEETDIAPVPGTDILL